MDNANCTAAAGRDGAALPLACSPADAATAAAAASVATMDALASNTSDGPPLMMLASARSTGRRGDAALPGLGKGSGTHNRRKNS